MQWWICWSPSAQLPYCFRFVVNDFGFIWTFMGDAKICSWALSLLARLFWLSSKWSYLDGYTPHCLMWCIWRERNSRSFEDIESYFPNLKLFIFRTLLDWLTAIRNFSLFSTVDLLNLCNFCNWLSTPIYFLYTWVTLFSDLYNNNNNYYYYYYYYYKNK